MSQITNISPAGGGGGAFVQTLTGNMGVAHSAINNINVITNNSTPIFIGAGSTLTLDFGLTNLMLGDNGALISTAVQNVSYGWGSLTSLTSGSSNSIFGFGAGQSLTTGFGNIAIGNQAGNSWDATTGNNIAIGSTAAAGEIATIRLGENGTHIATYIQGISGVNIGSVADVVSINTVTGQLGSTVITGGAGISITPGANTITISSTEGGLPYTEVTAATQALAVDNGYIMNRGTLITATLPAVAAQGSIIDIIGKGAGGWLIAQNAGQTIHFGTSNTTTGATGTLASTAQYDCVELICITANTDFVVKSVIGNLTVV